MKGNELMQRTHVLATLVFLLAFCVRGLLAFLMRDAPLVADARTYHSLAVYLVNHNLVPWDCTIQPCLLSPGLPYYAAVIYLIFGQGTIAVWLINALLSALTCVFVFLIGLRILPSRGATLLGAVVCSFWVPLLQFVPRLLTETLFIFLAIGAMLSLIVGVQKRQMRYFFLAGLCFGLATLVRTTLMFIPGLIGLVLIFIYRRLLPAVRDAVVLSVAMVLVISPWTYRNYRVTGRLVPVASAGGFMMWRGAVENQTVFDLDSKTFRDRPEWQAFPQKDAGDVFWMPEVDAYFQQRFLEVVRADPVGWASKVLQRFLAFWLQPIAAGRSTASLGNLLLILAARAVLYLTWFGVLLLAIVGAWRASLSPARWLLVGYMLYFSVVHALPYLDRRYRLPIEPFLLLFASAGCLWLIRWWRARRRTGTV